MNLDIVTERIELAANMTKVGAVDVISARAVAPLDRLLDWCEPFFGLETVALLPKGRDYNVELEAARKFWLFEAELVQSRTQADGRIVVVQKLMRA